MFTTRRDMQTWPHYADHAADNLEPLPLVEIGCATRRGKYAVQAQIILDQAEEATTGKCGSSDSNVYRSDPASEAVNTAVVRSTNRPDRQQPAVGKFPTSALYQVMERKEDIVGIEPPMLTHNLSGFDERACLRTRLTCRAELYMGRDNLPGGVSPQQAVLSAAENLLDSSKLPVFYQGHRPLRLLLNVLGEVLLDSDEHRARCQDLMRRAKPKGIKRLPCTLELAYQVHAYATGCFCTTTPSLSKFYVIS